jgi:hypothetical protein
VPSLGSRCGVAEYTNHLRDSIAQTGGSGAAVTIVKDPPGREEEVARDLAAQADILVFWYDQGLFASASGAARLGLATGVPVLTSPTRLFSDLTQVTYQPTELLPGIQRLLTETGFRQRLTDAARDYCHANNWAYTAPAPRRLERDQHLIRVTLCPRSNPADADSPVRPTPTHQSNWLSGTPTVRAYAMTSSRRCSSPCG